MDDALSEHAVQYATQLARYFYSTLFFCSVEAPADEWAGRHALDRAKEYAAANGVPAEELLLPLRDGVPKCDRPQCSRACVRLDRHGQPRARGTAADHRGRVTEVVLYSSDVPVVIVRAPKPVEPSAP